MNTRGSARFRVRALGFRGWGLAGEDAQLLQPLPEMRLRASAP